VTTRIALRWLPTFIGFPLGGLAAELVAGSVLSLLAIVIDNTIVNVALPTLVRA
jgi:hypothetical protein